jgi:FkbM family methyltransferase
VKFIEQIKSRSNRYSVLKEISDLKLPVVIYGAGLSGNNIHDYLRQNQISVIGFTVDKGYGEDTVMSGLPVKLIQHYDEAYEGYCVVIAMRNVARAVHNLQSHNSSNIKRVYVLCDSPQFIGLVYDYEYVKLYEEAFEEAYSYLADDLSRKTMLHYVNTIIANKFDLNEAKKLYDPDQYFAKDLIALNDEEVFVDCGAYDGDTLLSFMTRIREKKCTKYYALEPDKGNCMEIKKTIDQNHLANVEVIDKGVWDTGATLKFTGGTTINSCISSTGKVDVEVDSIDNLFYSDNTVTFIKMDVQGVELKALNGAVKTIMRDRPKLAICVYHKPEDLFKIPKYIKNLVPEYKLYMRHHAWSLIETVLYAVVP